MKWKRLVSIAAMLIVPALLATTATAIPKLQLYIDSPDVFFSGVQDDPWVDESWVTAQSAFDLWVLGSQETIYDVFATLSVLGGESGSITITPYDAGLPTVTITESDFVFGTPEHLSPHGIYPGLFYEYLIGDLVPGADQVYNMVDGGGPVPGEICKLHVSVSGFSQVHFDAHDTIITADKHKSVFAPYSHDALQQVIPEPATLGLFAFGLSLVGAVGALRSKRR